MAYIAMTHTYAKPHFARRVFDFTQEPRHQQGDEQRHLLIPEEMVQNKTIRENFRLHRLAPQVAAFACYHVSWLLYIMKPEWSYGLSADFEDHAEHEYMEYVRDNPAWETEPFESDFKADYGDYATTADLFRRIEELTERLRS